MSKKNELDRRRKYFLILDCETATLPFAQDLDASAKQKISLAKPLIYDLGWTITDKQGRIYKRVSYLISETFSVPAIFNTAYYASKKSIYLDLLKRDLISLVSWREATEQLVHDMEMVEAVGAYNAMFDFKKAIPFTEAYINNLYSPHFYEWEKWQTEKCMEILAGVSSKKEKTFEPKKFQFRNKNYPLFDVWALSCNHLLNNDAYRAECKANKWTTASGKYYKTSAETVYRFVKRENDFEEAHMALNDAEIETFLFAEAVKKAKGKIEIGIVYFPFRIIGKVEDDA